MKTIAMSGASGFVGSDLRRAFEIKGWKVIPLGRGDFEGSPEKLAGRIEGANAVLNLAGATVIKRWTREYKRVLQESRLIVTHMLVEAGGLMQKKPDVFISTSAVGFYDDEGEHMERKYKKADTFLGHLAEDSEREALRAGPLGIRTVVFRLGIVLGKNGGALKQMVKPFRLRLGGRIGNGKQHFSWVHIDDLINAYVAAVEDKSFSGIYNLTAPRPTNNMGLTRALGSALHRPAVLRVPKFALRLRYGEGARVLTGGQRVYPERLIDHGFRFRFTRIEDAVKNCVS
jgi:uncharacterized protein (TIGR01777 family)